MSKHFESETCHETSAADELLERDDAITRILNGSPLDAAPDDSFVLCWSKPKVGFGQATFYFKTDKKGVATLACESEGMSKDFVKEMLCVMVDNAEFED